jgi:hypothetical protein
MKSKFYCGEITQIKMAVIFRYESYNNWRIEAKQQDPVNNTKIHKKKSSDSNKFSQSEEIPQMYFVNIIISDISRLYENIFFKPLDKRKKVI